MLFDFTKNIFNKDLSNKQSAGNSYAEDPYDLEDPYDREEPEIHTTVSLTSQPAKQKGGSIEFPGLEEIERILSRPVEPIDLADFATTENIFSNIPHEVSRTVTVNGIFENTEIINSDGSRSTCIRNMETGWMEIQEYEADGTPGQRVYGHSQVSESDPPVVPETPRELTAQEQKVQDVYDMLSCAYSLASRFQENCGGCREIRQQENPGCPRDPEVFLLRAEIDTQQMKLYARWLYDTLVESYGYPKPYNPDDWYEAYSEPIPAFGPEMLEMSYEFYMTCYNDLQPRLEELLRCTFPTTHRMAWLALKDSIRRFPLFRDDALGLADYVACCDD